MKKKERKKKTRKKEIENLKRNFSFKFIVSALEFPRKIMYEDFCDWL